MWSGLTNIDFINKSKIIHGDEYDYTETDYTSKCIKVKISCKIHGVFTQRPDTHLNGCGCPFCGDRKKTVILKNELSVDKGSFWGLRGKRSVLFDSFKVYIIKCWGNNEKFYKIGRTFKTINNRFFNSRGIPYEYEIIHEIIFEDYKEAFEKEVHLKEINSEHIYIPNKIFPGYSECFYKIIIK